MYIKDHTIILITKLFFLCFYALQVLTVGLFSILNPLKSFIKCSQIRGRSLYTLMQEAHMHRLSTLIFLLGITVLLICQHSSVVNGQLLKREDLTLSKWHKTNYLLFKNVTCPCLAVSCVERIIHRFVVTRAWRNEICRCVPDYNRPTAKTDHQEAKN